MEGVGRQRKRRYTEDYKAEVVRLCLAGEKPITTVAQELGLARSMVQRWVARWETDTGQGGEALSSSEREELGRLRRENRILREERDILRRATAFFAKETR